MTITRFTNVRFLGLPLAAPLLGILLALLIADTAAARIWTDASGKHKIDAEFVKLADGVVHLQRPDQSILELSLNKLSQADQNHLATLRQPKELPTANTGDGQPPIEEGVETIRLHAVVAEGIGRKKNEAISNALRNAVRQALGVLVSAKDLIKYDESIEGSLMSDIAVFVDKHKKLSDARVGGAYRVTIEAGIIQDELLKALGAAGIPLLPVEIQHQFSSVAKLDLGDEKALDADLKANPFAIRNADQRARAIKRNGGNRKTEKAVQGGLVWLARHQNGNGSWSFNHTRNDNCSGFPNPGTTTSKMGATGIALSAFLGAGHTHKKKSEFQKTVRAGLGYLVSNMDSSGRLFEKRGPSGTHMYCHAMAACALAEAYGMTQDKKLKKPAEMAVRYLTRDQDTVGGGWDDVPGAAGNASVSGWAVMALKSAELAKLRIGKRTYSNAMKFLDSVRHVSNHGIIYYLFQPNKPNGHPTAKIVTALLCRTYMGWEQGHAELQNGVAICNRNGPQPDDMIYNYNSSMFMFQNDGPSGPSWEKWNTAMQGHFIGSQESDDDSSIEGSWYFHESDIHLTATSGGRLLHTALATMALETYYRYPRFYDQK